MLMLHNAWCRPDPSFSPASLGQEYEDLRSKRARRFDLDNPNKAARNSALVGSHLGSTLSTPEPEYNPVSCSTIETSVLAQSV